MTLHLNKLQRSVSDVVHMVFTTELRRTHIQACGILSAALAETSMGLDWSKGGALNVNVAGDNDHSFGLWQIQAVQALLVPPPKGPGIDIRKATILEQCRALDWMLRSGAPKDRQAGEELERATTPEEAAMAMVDFERPRDRAKAKAERVPYAIGFDKLYGGVA